MYAKSLYYDQTEYLLSEEDMLLEDRYLLKRLIQKTVLTLDLIADSDIRYFDELRQVNKSIKSAKFESVLEELQYHVDKELVDLQLEFGQLEWRPDEPIERVFWENRFHGMVDHLKDQHINMMNELVYYPLENLLDKGIGLGTIKLLIREMKKWLERQLKVARGESPIVSEDTIDNLMAEFFDQREHEVE